MKNFLALALLLVVPALPATSLPVQELYRRGVAGDKAAVEECIAQLETALQAQPANQLARVYLGSAYTLRSRNLGFGPAKLRALRHGLALMDEAVAAAPEEPKVRLARALTTAALPAFFGRGAESRRDFEFLRALARKHPRKFDADDLRTLAQNAPRQ